MGYFQTFWHGLSLIHLDLIRIFCTALKLYKGVCLTYVFLEQMMLVSPFKWPVSAITYLAQPYFKLCRTFFPPDILRAWGFNFSSILGWEVLSFIVRIIELYIEAVSQSLI
jgi:uncharacterized protein YggT (Ycf19 family)